MDMIIRTAPRFLFQAPPSDIKISGSNLQTAVRVNFAAADVQINHEQDVQPMSVGSDRSGCFW